MAIVALNDYGLSRVEKEDRRRHVITHPDGIEMSVQWDSGRPINSHKCIDNDKVALPSLVLLLHR